MKYYKVVTYGCQMNEHESEKLCGILEKFNLIQTDDESLADVIVFNTCTIRENAERRAYGNIGALKKLKKANKEKIIAVGGCLTQQKGKAQELKEKFPFIDIIFGTHNLSEFEQMLNRRIETGKKFIDVSTDEYKMPCQVPVKRSTYPSAYVNVMYGCNNFCTYCIVPYVRGRERSRTPEEILVEVQGLINEGYKEITLLGQNVDSYGKDLNPKVDFSSLLKMVASIDGKFRIRFISNHPKDVNEKLAETIKNNEKICNSIHFPVQSGSTNVLALMNRRYTREDYLKKIKMLRKTVKDIAITTDIMVGFPNETEKDFKQSLSLLKKVKYDGAFTFVYSKRSGTKAFDMDGHIDESIKKERIVKLVEVQNNVNKKLAKKYVGKTVEVLVDEFNTACGYYMGRDERGKAIHFSSDRNVVGEFLQIKITRADGISVYGEIV
ncbi:MAG: tRNA (N6-isopentenyl adenosine(37)-C2)-methylthiotransferase MiaB [Clostridiales bacterium]|nr:tRNA (N6-isopentenyl adenosine(37)-C2)-methylthiotransferase MiaB [Clostridiales bacterium]